MRAALVLLVLCSVANGQGVKPDDATIERIITASDRERPKLIGTGKKLIAVERSKVASAKRASIFAGGENISGKRYKSKEDRDIDVLILQAGLNELESAVASWEDKTGIPPPQLKSDLPLPLGTFGIYDGPIKVDQVISKTEFRGSILKDFPAYYRGFSTAGMSDGNSYVLPGVMLVTGTKTYTTVLGGTNTLIVIEPIDWKYVTERYRVLRGIKR